jgi:signal transduction histidine kinase/CheY-like chemotaxis protein
MPKSSHSLPHSEGDFLNILRSSPDLYLILNHKLEIVEVSEAYLAATMVKRKDIIGQGIFEVFPDNPNDPAATGVNNLRASLERVLQNKTADTMAVQKYDIRRPLSKGGGFEERYWSPHNSPVLDENNTVKFIIHRVEDVTEHIRLSESKSQMEIEIYKRAQELQETNQKLRIANVEAQEANRAKSAFLAAMSHEIRTPLNGIIGMTSLLLNSEIPADIRDSVEIMHVSGENLLHVINDILDFSKIEAGHLDIEQIDFDVYHLVDEVTDIIGTQVYKKRLELGVDIDADVPTWLNGDPSRIHQVLLNLLSNAVKFTEHGEISIKVKIGNDYALDDKNKLSVLFEVSDSGIGMPAEVQSRIFQPFSQGDASVTRRYGGTGLGLSISKRLIEIMGGAMEVESTFGKGSVFKFMLPLGLCPARPQASKFDRTFELKNVRVLCVDDNEINRNIIKHQTESWSMRCDVVADPWAALAMLKNAAIKNDPYQLALIDYSMPTLDGLELIKLIHQSGEIPHMPIILLSSIIMNLSTEVKE